MRFEVPQFIEVEDKIFGPLSWRQFLYLGGGIGMSVVMFLTLPLLLFVIFGLPLAALSGALAFYPVNNRPFSYFLEAMINYVRGNRLYVWKQNTEAVYRGSARVAATPSYPVKPGGLDGSKPKKGVASLARQLELQALQKDE